MSAFRSCLAIGSLWFLVAFSAASAAASCPGGGPKPAWVANPDAITVEHFWSAGVSNENTGPLSTRLASARQDAIKNLAGLIEVNVRNSLSLEQTRREGGGSVITDSNVRSLTETSTNASLQNVEATETWEDPASCQVWVRVRVERKIVELKKREGIARQLFSLLTEKLALAQNSSGAVDARQGAIEAALDLLPRIAFELIPEASSLAYYQQVLKRSGDALGSARGEIREAKALLDEAEGNINKAGAQTIEAARSKYMSAAVSAFKSLLYRHPSGLTPLFGPGDLLMKLGEIEEIRGNSCSAKSYYEQAKESKQLVDRRTVASARAAGLTCSPSDMEKAMWRQFFEGRSVEIVCLHNTRGAPSAWPKACDEVSNVVRSLGAETKVSGARIPAGQAQEILKGEIPADLGKDGNAVIGYVASGQMSSRVDSESGKSGKEYRFEGMIWTLVYDNGRAVFSDRFQGTTGWNPISPDMVMDVLALNVAKRWQDKFSRFLRHEVDK